MTSWLPQWRVTIGDDVYTTVTSASYSAGRVDIDRQATAGYAKVEIINTTGAAFTIDVTDTLTLELKDSAGAYVSVFGGSVSDFSIGVRSPEESGFITVGTVLAVGSLAKLTRAFYTDSVTQDLDGAQISTILNALLRNSWSEVAPTVAWNTYDATTTWTNAENVGLGTIDTGLYDMIQLTPSDDRNTYDTVAQIANSALGQIFEDNQGRICYSDADHRTTYLATYGYTDLDSSYATPSSVKSILQIGKIRNSLIINYNNNYASQYSDTDEDSIVTYGRYQNAYNSNIKNLADVTAIATRDLGLRAIPRSQLEAVTFRLDNPNMPDAQRDALINAFFGQPIILDNLPSNMFLGVFDGFVESVTLRATPTYVDLTLYVSPTAFSIVAMPWSSVSALETWTTINPTLQWLYATIVS